MPTLADLRANLGDQRGAHFGGRGANLHTSLLSHRPAPVPVRTLPSVLYSVRRRPITAPPPALILRASSMYGARQCLSPVPGGSASLIVNHEDIAQPRAFASSPTLMGSMTTLDSLASSRSSSGLLRFTAAPPAGRLAVPMPSQALPTPPVWTPRMTHLSRPATPMGALRVSSPELGRPFSPQLLPQPSLPTGARVTGRGKMQKPALQELQEQQLQSLPTFKANKPESPISIMGLEPEAEYDETTPPVRPFLWRCDLQPRGKFR